MSLLGLQDLAPGRPLTLRVHGETDLDIVLNHTFNENQVCFTVFLFVSFLFLIRKLHLSSVFFLNLALFIFLCISIFSQFTHYLDWMVQGW